MLFPNLPYVLLEDPDTLYLSKNDPRGFLEQYGEGAIFDEIQNAPQLFSYLQGVLDKTKKTGRFILTGSQNYLMMQNISQSLAGRVAILELLPLSLHELQNSHYNFKSYEELLFNGFYPRKYDKNIAPHDYYSNYVKTYIERDIRLLKNVHDQTVFHKFLKMCANRVGQILNVSSLGDDCGITHNTAKAWMSLLETSYIVYLLKPYHKNLNKRLIKSPKLYFYDVGLASFLADIDSIQRMQNHPLKGGLFENMILSELIKQRFNNGKNLNLFFWHDQSGREIDIIIDDGGPVQLIEVKAGRTVNSDYFKHLAYMQELLRKHQNISNESYLIYGGDKGHTFNTIKVTPWNKFV